MAAPIPAFNKQQLEELEKITEVEDRIRWFYTNGTKSIQDIARTHRMSVEEVLVILDMSDIASSQLVGDQIDQKEAGPEVTVNTEGKAARANFSTN